MAGGSSVGLLRANPTFRALWLSRSISYLGDSMALVALLLHVADERGEAGAVAALLLVGDFAPSLLGPVAGAVGDRFDLRRVLVGCELLQAVVVGVLALTLPPLVPLLALVAARSVTAQVFHPASRAVVPSLVDDAELEAANAAVGFGANGMEAVGPLVAALLLPVIGVRGVLAVDAASFLASALLLVRLPALPKATDERSTFLGEVRAGLRHLLAAPVVRVVALGFVAVVTFTAVDDVALVFLARDVLGGTSGTTAALYAAVGLGLLLGFALLGRRQRLPAATALAVGGFAVASTGNLLTGLAPSLAAAFLCQAVRGTGIAAVDVGTTTVVRREVPAALQARVFGTMYGAVGAAAAASYLLGALLLDATSPRTTFVVAGAGGIASTALTVLALRRSRR